MSWHANRFNCPGSNLLDATRTKSVRNRCIRFGFVQFRSTGLRDPSSQSGSCVARAQEEGLSVCSNLVGSELCDEQGHSLGHLRRPRLLRRLLLHLAAYPHARPFLTSSHNHTECYYSSTRQKPYPGHESLSYLTRHLVKTRQRPCCTGAQLRVPNTSRTLSGKICFSDSVQVQET